MEDWLKCQISPLVKYRQKKRIIETDYKLFLNWVNTLESKLIGYLQNFNWVLVKFIWVTEPFSYIFYATSAILIGYSIICLLFDTPCLKKKIECNPRTIIWSIPPKSSLSVSLQYTLIGYKTYHFSIHLSFNISC